MIDRGSGIPVVLIPGLQGRWEWMAPTVDALAAHCRVITFSLADEPTSGFRWDERVGFESYVEQVGEALRRADVQNAVIVGVSYSGLVAAEFAARHPERVRGLVLASALPPDWTPDRRARFYLRSPRLLAPLFVIGSPLRMAAELRAALPLGARLRFGLAQAFRAARWPAWPSLLARRVRWMEAHRFADVSALSVPALVVTGEDALDRIVAPRLTRRYLGLIPHSRYVTLPCTGHLGCVTRPETFAEIVSGFANETSSDAKRISA